MNEDMMTYGTRVPFAELRNVPCEVNEHDDRLDALDEVLRSLDMTVAEACASACNLSAVRMAMHFTYLSPTFAS